MKNLLIIVILLSLVTTIFAQNNSIYNLSIHDENGAEIGQYFDIQIDSISIISDTTLNFQMIPNLDITDSMLQTKYSTFLELLKRNTGKELSAVRDFNNVIGKVSSQNNNWTQSIDVFIGDEFNDTDEIVREIITEFNEEIGFQFFSEIFQQTNNGWNFDYSNVDWKLDRNVERDIIFSENGIPKSCIFFIHGLFQYPNDLKTRLRKQFIEVLFLFKDFENKFSETGDFDEKYFKLTKFSSDFYNIVKILTALNSEHNFRSDRNEINRSPVAFITLDQTDYNVGQQIILNGNNSFDPDGSIESYCWEQIFATKTGFEYCTSNGVILSDSCSTSPTFIPSWPGKYRFKLTITDNGGLKNSCFVNVSVYWDNNPMKFRGINTFAYYDPTVINTYVADLVTKFSTDDHANWIEFAPYWWMEDKSSTNIHPLDELWIPGSPGITIADTTLKQLIDVFHSNNLKVLLRPTLEFYNWADWRGNLEPTNWQEWFDSYNNFIIHYAQIAEEKNVELFAVGNELHNATAFTDNWRVIIQNVKSVYSGEITYSDAALPYKIGMSNVQFWDDLDYIGVDFYRHITGSGAYWDTGYPPMLDPPFDIFIQSLENCLNNILLPVHQEYNKPILITESGCRNIDGENINIGFWSGAAIDNKEQSDYFEAIFQTISDKEWISGFFVFVFDLKLDINFVNEDWPLSFRIKNKPAREVFKYWYR